MKINRKIVSTYRLIEPGSHTGGESDQKENVKNSNNWEEKGGGGMGSLGFDSHIALHPLPRMGKKVR